MFLQINSKQLLLFPPSLADHRPPQSGYFPCEHLQHSGHRVIDAAALKTLKQWFYLGSNSRDSETLCKIEINQGEMSGSSNTIYQRATKLLQQHQDTDYSLVAGLPWSLLTSLAIGWMCSCSAPDLEEQQSYAHSDSDTFRTNP